MPSGSLGQLTIDLAANVTKFERALNRSERLADKRAKSMVRHFKRAATGIGLALSTLGLIKATENAFSFADAMGKAADRAGVSTDKLQEMRFAMDQFGVTTQQTDDGLRRFTRRLGVALEGGSFAKAFDDMGVAIRDSNNAFLGTEAVLDATIDALAAFDDQATRSAFAAQVFGDDAGPQMSVALAQGGEALREYARRAHESGAIMRADVIDAAEDANDQLSELANTLRVQFSTAIIQAAPAIQAAGKALLDFVVFVGKAAGGIDAMNTDEVEQRIRSLGAEIIRVQTKLASVQELESGDMFERALARFMPSPEALQERIAKLEAMQNEAFARLGEINLAATKDKKRPNPLTGMTDEELAASNERQWQAVRELHELIAEEEKALAEQRKNDQLAVQNFTQASQQSIAANAIGLLQTLGRENKNYARAAIILQKGLAIAEAKINTAVAVTAALRYDPTGATAARVGALGAAQIALIAATGIGQLAALNSGGGGGIAGTSAAPIATTPTDIVTGQPLSGGAAGTITINVNGVVTEEILQDLIIPAIQDSVDNRDVILFRSDSRQALELTA